MKGAIVFVVAFIIFLAATLAYPELPPGRQIYDILGVEESTEPVLGIAVTTLVCAIVNGVIYGIIIWLIFTGLRRAEVIG